MTLRRSPPSTSQPAEPAAPLPGMLPATTSICGPLPVQGLDLLSWDAVLRHTPAIVCIQSSGKHLIERGGHLV